jgi:hypothetical protein
MLQQAAIGPSSTFMNQRIDAPVCKPQGLAP